MKRILAALCAALFWGAAALGGAEPFRAELAADPQEFPAGSATMISITLNRDDFRGELPLPQLPGAVWHPGRKSMSRSLRFVNGRSSRSVTYSLPLSAETPGALVIPPLEFVLPDGKTARSNELKLKVLAPGERASAPVPAIPEGSIGIPAGARRENYYVGEAIPLELTLSIPPRTRIGDIDYPELLTDGPAAFPDFTKSGKSRHPHFTVPREGIAGTQGHRRKVLIFDTCLRFMKPGEFRVSAREMLTVAIPAARRRKTAEDDFFSGGLFDSFFDDVVRRKVEVNYPPITLRIAALPPPPAGVADLGAIGEWKIGTTLSAHSAKVGEPVELRVTLSGRSSGDGLKAPSLELPGFRVYPPEVKTDPEGGLSVCYALIPLAPGEHTVSPRFAFFDPREKRYVVDESALALAVAGQGAAIPASSPTVSSPLPVPASAAERDELFYQKPDAGKAVRIPLVRNAAIPAAAFGALALAALAVEICSRRRERCAADPDHAARAERRALAKQLARRLRRGEDAASVLRDGGLELLALGAGLPPGSTASEVAERVSDPEVRKFLEDMGRSAFAPESVGAGEAPRSVRGKLSKLLARAGLWLVLALCGAELCAGEAYNAAFERGEYEVAAKRYLGSAAAPGAVHPDALYNAGCAEFKAGNAPLARLYLERAHLLSPRDAEIAENLDLVDRALFQGEAHRADTPRGFFVACRDLFRPDEYVGAALVCLGMALLAWALRRRIGPWPAAAAALLTVLALTSAAFQLAGAYHPSRAIVTARELELRSLPVVRGGRTDARIPGGGDAIVIERRGDWVRLEVNGRDGWAESSAVTQVFPYGFW